MSWLRLAIAVGIVILVAIFAFYLLLFLLILGVISAVFFWFRRHFIEPTPSTYDKAADWVANDDAAAGEIIDGDYEDVTNEKK